MRDRFLLVGGEQLAVDFDVEHSARLDGHPRAPGAVVDLLVLHDTAGEGDGGQVQTTLERRHVSAHLEVDRSGLVWQYMDLLARYSDHAGSVNGRSIGVEITNLVFPPLAPSRFANARLPLTGTEKTYGRPIIVDTYRGMKRRVLGHLPEQIETVRKLVAAVRVAFPTIPAVLPRDPDGKVHGNRVLPRFAGVCGHLHVSDAHVDPALDVLYALEADLV